MTALKIWTAIAIVASYVVWYAGIWVAIKFARRDMVAEGVLVIGATALLFAMSRLVML